MESNIFDKFNFSVLARWIAKNVKIEDIARDYVDLEKKGNYLVAPSPFLKNSKEDSKYFVVSPLRNIFYCFGSQRGGDVISFVAALESLTQNESIRFIIEKCAVKPLESDLQEIARVHGNQSMRELVGSYAQKIKKAKDSGDMSELRSILEDFSQHKSEIIKRTRNEHRDENTPRQV